MTTSKDLVLGISASKMATKSQKILLTLVKSQDKDGWVSGNVLRKYSTNLSSLRDLRREKFGAFTIQSAHASEIGKKTDSFYYRVVLSSKKDLEKLKKVLAI